MSENAKSLTEKMRLLSSEQLAEVEDFIEFIRLRGQDRAIARAASLASTPALAAVWNNPEDDIYNAL